MNVGKHGLGQGSQEEGTDKLQVKKKERLKPIGSRNAGVCVYRVCGDVSYAM